jgi:hypothetical protein
MMKQRVKILTPSKGEIDEFKRLSNKAMGHLVNQSFSKKVWEEVTSILEGYRRGER